MKGTTEKNARIQVLRGIAIVAVVLIHTCPKGLWQVYFRPFINFAVGLFLFLSGYLTSWEQESWGRFFKKRLLRVLIPYVIWTVVYTLVKRQPERLAFNLLTTSGAFHLYFIAVYVQLVLLTPLIKMLAASRFRWIGWLVAPVSILLFSYPGVIFPSPLPDRLSLFWFTSCLGWFSYYYLGLLLRQTDFSIPDTFSRHAPLWIALALFLQVLEGRLWLALGYPDPGTPLKLSALVCNLFIMAAAFRYIRDGKTNPSSFWVQVGDCSFGIYLSHVLFLWLFSSISFFRHIPFPINSALILLTSFALVYCSRKLAGDKIIRWIGFN